MQVEWTCWRRVCLRTWQCCCRTIAGVGALIITWASPTGQIHVHMWAHVVFVAKGNLFWVIWYFRLFRNDVWRGACRSCIRAGFVFQRNHWPRVSHSSDFHVKERWVMMKWTYVHTRLNNIGNTLTILETPNVVSLWPSNIVCPTCTSVVWDTCARLVHSQDEGILHILKDC